jgi:hypothetical protein
MNITLSTLMFLCAINVGINIEKKNHIWAFIFIFWTVFDYFVLLKNFGVI